jgi:predicted NAD/FAD-binding protein
VIIASHGNQAMSMLHNPTEEEKEVLTAFKTQPNRVVLHRDLSQMPKAKKAWASWVYMSDGEVDTRKHIAVTYWMNRLQSIDYSKPLFVTVNPITEPDPSLVFQEFEYHHPIFDFPAIQSQEQIDTIQGKRGIWFCGAYQRYGFHEDGLQSALKVVNALGVKAPWQ